LSKGHSSKPPDVRAARNSTQLSTKNFTGRPDQK
jgi:hypothetical protein